MSHEDLRDKLENLSDKNGTRKLKDMLYTEELDAIMALFESQKFNNDIEQFTKGQWNGYLQMADTLWHSQKHLESGDEPISTFALRHKKIAEDALERISANAHYVLQICPYCNQMTNHLHGICQKHEPPR